MARARRAERRQRYEPRRTIADPAPVGVCGGASIRSAARVSRRFCRNEPRSSGEHGNGDAGGCRPMQPTPEVGQIELQRRQIRSDDDALPLAASVGQQAGVNRNLIGGQDFFRRIEFENNGTATAASGQGCNASRQSYSRRELMMQGSHPRTKRINLTRPRWWLLWFFAAAAVAIAVAALITITRAPLPVHEGTAPSVVTGSVGAEAEPLRQPGTIDPRDATESGTGARAARGSGVEGVTSGGTTQAAPDGR